MKLDKKNKILVPTDFTPVGDCAIRHAVEVAKKHDDEVSIFHVIEGKKNAEERLNEAKEKLEINADRIEQEHGIRPETIVREGNIFDHIGQVADEIGAGLVIMGTHGMKGMQYITGSYALKVITNSKVPFIIVQTREIREKAYQTIAFPIDLSRECKEKLAWATFLANYFNAKFHIIYMKETDEFLVNKVRNNLVYTKNFLKENRLSYSMKEAEEKGSFSDQVLKFSSEIDADLIMIMTNKDAGVKEFVLGPQEVQVMSNKAEIPVMTINPRKDIYIEKSLLSQSGLI